MDEPETMGFPRTIRIGGSAVPFCRVYLVPANLLSYCENVDSTKYDYNKFPTNKEISHCNIKLFKLLQAPSLRLSE